MKHAPADRSRLARILRTHRRLATAAARAADARDWAALDAQGPEHLRVLALAHYYRQTTQTRTNRHGI